ncbi:podocalyxin [Scyliorhinus torazame]|uniref:podocalyxin n=1 Tax=Scyliorhinus torazame TaxID=75743 RepID=UPI003B58B59C
MKLLFVVCFLGSTWAISATNSTTIQKQPAGVPSITSTSTQNSTTPKTDITTQSSVATQTIESPESTSNKGTMEGKSSAPTMTSKLSTVSSSGTSKVISSTTTTLTPVANVTSNTTIATSTAQRATTIVPTTSVTSSSSAPPQNQSSTSKTVNSTTRASANTTMSDNQTTTGASESQTTANLSNTTSGGLGQAAQESTQTDVTPNSTRLVSTPENGTVAPATTGSLQTNPMTLQNALTGTYKDVTNGTQESTVTALTTRSVSSRLPDNTPRANVQSTVKCVPESSNQTSVLALLKYDDCGAFVHETRKRLIDLFCSKLVEKVDLQTKPFEGKQEVDSKEIDDFLASLPKGDLQEMGITFSANKGDSNERQTATELKKLIAMVVTGSLLVLVFLSAIIYRCAQRKSQLKKDQCLKGDMYMVDNGCHDNPAMDVIESEPEMQEKTISKANCQENMDGWIVPIDSFSKSDLEEEDTHL